MEMINLSDTLSTKVDDEDFAHLNRFNWSRCSSGYAVRRKILNSGRRVVVYMHREVLNFPRGFDVDHINGDKLDNRKSNLRAVTKQQNQFNRGAIKGSSSKYKGVSWLSAKKLWRASIKIDTKYRHIGLFTTEIVAAAAYNAIAIEHHGDYARLNDVPLLENWMEYKAFSTKGKSKYRGVSLHKTPNRWKASISFENKRIHIGIYASEIEAAKAYNAKALELRGDKAVLNPVEKGLISSCRS
jgi:hypothetical protein